MESSSRVYTEPVGLPGEFIINALPQGFSCIAFFQFCRLNFLYPCSSRVGIYTGSALVRQPDKDSLPNKGLPSKLRSLSSHTAINAFTIAVTAQRKQISLGLYRNPLSRNNFSQIACLNSGIPALLV